MTAAVKLLYLITVHTLLGKLVEVSPDCVSQEVNALHRLFLKHLWGETWQKHSAHLHSIHTVSPILTFVIFQVLPHRPWYVPSASHREPFPVWSHSADTTCLPVKHKHQYKQYTYGNNTQTYCIKHPVSQVLYHSISAVVIFKSPWFM